VFQYILGANYLAMCTEAIDIEVLEDAIGNGRSAIYSPLSVLNSLMVLGYAADEDIVEEFLRMCGGEIKIPELGESKGICVVGNSVWINEKFKDEVSKEYIAKIFPMVKLFVADFSKVGELMNDWVTTESKGMIRRVNVDVPKEAACVISNMIYFKCDWRMKFPVEGTYDGEFSGGKGKSGVRMMREDVRNCGYMSNHGLRAIELPYENKEFSMIVAMDDRAVVPLTKSMVDKISKLMSPESTVEVHLPRFEAESEINVGELLKKKFPNIFGASYGKISKDFSPGMIYQKAKIVVDEAGTEAAAATMVFSNGGHVTPIFIANRTFSYCIVYKPLMLILFTGIFSGV